MRVTTKKPYKNAAKLAQSLSGQMIKSLSGSTARLLTGDSSEAAIARGKVFQLAGYFAEAADSYTEALGSKSEDEAASRLVLVQLMARQPEKALATATALASRNPGYEFKEMTSNQRISALTLLGDALVYNGRLNDAIKAYKRARATSSKDAAAAGRLAQAYHAVGEPKKAQALAKEIGKNPRFARLSAVLAGDVQTLPAVGIESLTAMLQGTPVGRPLIINDTVVLAPIVNGSIQWCADFGRENAVTSDEREQVGRAV